jgi:aspartate carbamoyltransferase catalytic subunit
LKFETRHVIGIDDFSVDELVGLFSTTDRIIDHASEYNESLKSNYMAVLFWEPSTRTKSSFIAAGQQLGMQADATFTSEMSSAAKGETIADTIRMFCGYGADVIVMRHSKEGAAYEAAKYADHFGTHVINGGDGGHEHPTQTMLDLYTVFKELDIDFDDNLKGQKIALCGDLKYGRTTHSLIKALGRFGADVLLVAPERFQMPKEFIEKAQSNGATVRALGSLEEAIDQAQVLYVTRIQKERFAEVELPMYEEISRTYQVNRALLSRSSNPPIIMHPLPRVTEIAPDVDAMPCAAYFRQARNGRDVRKALLYSLLKGEL